MNDSIEAIGPTYLRRDPAGLTPAGPAERFFRNAFGRPDWTVRVEGRDFEEYGLFDVLLAAFRSGTCRPGVLCVDLGVEPNAEDLPGFGPPRRVLEVPLVVDAFTGAWVVARGDDDPDGTLARLGGARSQLIGLLEERCGWAGAAVPLGRAMLLTHRDELAGTAVRGAADVIGRRALGALPARLLRSAPSHRDDRRARRLLSDLLGLGAFVRVERFLEPRIPSWLAADLAANPEHLAAAIDADGIEVGRRLAFERSAA